MLLQGLAMRSPILDELVLGDAHAARHSSQQALSSLSSSLSLPLLLLLLPSFLPSFLLCRRSSGYGYGNLEHQREEEEEEEEEEEGLCTFSVFPPIAPLLSSQLILTMEWNANGMIQMVMIITVLIHIPLSKIR
jgi:hypothetical protein